MAGDPFYENLLRFSSPHTYNALQKLVMAMADVVKKAGKPSFFGRDKGQEAYSHFLQSLKVTLQSMVLDGVIQESMPTEEVLVKLEEKLLQFARAYPNWEDAYGFASTFLGDSRPDARATVERLRAMP